MFAALGRLASQRPWFVIATWLILAVLIAAFAPSMKSSSDQSDFLPHHYESIKATNLLSDAFPSKQDVGATVVFDHEDGSALSAADLTKIDAIGKGLKLGSAFSSVEATTVSPDAQKAAIVNIDLADGVTGQKQSDLDQVKTLRDDLASAVKGTDLRVGVTGSLAQSYDQSQSGKNAEAIVMLATILLIIVLLGWIFRSVLAAVTPIVIVIVAFIIAHGLIAISTHAFNLQADDSLNVILGVVLFGIGTDYFLFFLFRFREMRRGGADHKSAVTAAVERAGEAIASAGGVVVVAFLTLTLSSLGMFKSMGPALAIAVATMLLAALTLVPAVVTVLGRAVFWPSKKWQNEPTGTGFARLGTSVGKNPGRYAAVAGAVLVLLSIAALNFKPLFNLSETNSSQAIESVVTQKRMEDKGFSAGATQPTIVVLHSDKGALTQAQLSEFGAALAKVPDAALATAGAGAPAVTASPTDPSTAIAQLLLKSDPSSDAAIASIKDAIRPAVHAAAPAGTQAYVGGLTSVFVDFKAAMERDYKVVFPVAALITLLILMLVLRSLVAPWYLMISVGLGFSATLGSATLVFQTIKGDDGLVFMLPILIYLFVVALGTDYNILMVTRLREEAREGKGPRDAAAWAIRHTGPTIASAGVILAGTFAALMLGGNSFLVTMGFSVAFGICLAAGVMAMFLTPGLTALIGHAAWWPGHGDRATHEELSA
ncbi:MMPL family transporter [Nocardioides sp.]|uniref:MMPL family transporter n=1 Tax=Nocardioides sp. TaxID=35761 RepID=UPI002607B8F1|nr:MMPL family transporter [Nocardioides sp.]